MPVLHNITTLLPCTDRNRSETFQEISDAAIAWEGGRISWVGSKAELPMSFSNEQKIDAQGGIVIPGLIDCHTHLIFGGWREGDFRKRIGSDRGDLAYAKSHKEGGGIYETVEKTHSASDEELLLRAKAFLLQMRRMGITCVEVKSGYGISIENERRILRLYGKLLQDTPLPLEVTFLAHLVPKNFSLLERERYLGELLDFLDEVKEMKYVSACDVFVEKGAFTVDEGRALLEKARALGLSRKLHADQLSDGGGGALAAETGALSADHLEYISQESITKMHEKGVVAVLLPFASWYLKHPFAQGRMLKERGLRVAVATDFNPGSAPSFSLPLALTFACINNGLFPEEALEGATLSAAYALGVEKECGSLEVGKRADMVVLQADSITQWLYHVQPNAVKMVVLEGKVVEERSTQ